VLQTWAKIVETAQILDQTINSISTFYPPSPALDQCCFSRERMTFRGHNIVFERGRESN